jgi:hypothetical protein
MTASRTRPHGGQVLIIDTGGGNRALAERVARVVRQHPHRTPERRAAAMVYVALTTTKTADAARRALATFGDPSTRAAAAALLGQLEQETSCPPHGRAG